MKKLFIFMVTGILSLTACAPKMAPLSPPLADTPNVISSTSQPGRPDLTPEEQAVVSALAEKLNLMPDQANQIMVVSLEAVDWPDGCMGVQRIGMMCTQGIVPGYRMLLEYNGQQYEYHTNRDVSVIVPIEGLLVSGAAEQAAIQRLSQNLGVDAGQILLLSSSVVQWNDGCLGVAIEGQRCTEGLITGYLIVLSVNGFEYEYHTNEDGSQLMPATLALDWREQGGIAGMCKSLKVYLSGEVYGLDCTAGGGQFTSTLPLQELGQITGWFNTFQNTVIDLSDPQGVSDGMTRTADLMGRGANAANDNDKQMIFDLGQKIFDSLH